jgi:transcriptional regulator with XRE-family HTH domain
MARADAGLTISELAKRAGVSRDTISNAERGERSLQASTLHKVAHALGKAPSELLAEEERLAPKVTGRSSLEPSLFNGVLAEERRAGVTPWAAYTRRIADRIQGHADDPDSPAFRDPWAALFFLEDANRTATDLCFFIDGALSEALENADIEAMDELRSAFEELGRAIGSTDARARVMVAGLARSELGQQRRRTEEAAAERETAAARSAHLGRRTA